MTWNANECSLRYMRAAGERNFQSEGGRFKEIITLRLPYIVSMSKVGGRSSDDSLSVLRGFSLPHPHII